MKKDKISIRVRGVAVAPPLLPIRLMRSLSLSSFSHFHIRLLSL